MFEILQKSANFLNLFFVNARAHASFLNCPGMLNHPKTYIEDFLNRCLSKKRLGCPNLVTVRVIPCTLQLTSIRAHPGELDLQFFVATHQIKV